jgi:hypothetical protein
MRMRKYGYAVVSYSTYRVNLMATVSQVLDWVLDELKKFGPSQEIEYKIESKLALSPDETYQVEIACSKAEDGVLIGWWVIKQLCLQGWEPFEVEGSAIHFRFEW